MGKKFTMLLLGPAGSGKSTFISSLSEIDIFSYVTAKTAGGANTTKILTTYVFDNRCKSVDVLECITSDVEQQEKTLEELRQLISENNGLEKIFKKINSAEFARKCISITLKFPCKKDIIPIDSNYDTIIIRDSMGFGDEIGNKKFEIDDIGITDDINTILFFSISSIQQPAIFAKIIDEIMKVNLKTPMFLLRRDEDLTQNDEDFKEKVLQNLKQSDGDLKQIVEDRGNSTSEFRLNNLVFYVPEVKKWKGALSIPEGTHSSQVDSYDNVIREIIRYAFNMYDELYKLITNKMNGVYQKRFVHHILNKLISDEAFNVVTTIVSNPYVIPGENYYYDRDTRGLKNPVQLYDTNIREGRPFKNEISKNGNQYDKGIIPCYSYACVNFRELMGRVIYNLINISEDKDLTEASALYHTFMDILLEDFTITTTTGYSIGNCKRNSFKFYILTDIRENATELLAQNSLVDENGTWKDFSYKPISNKFTGSEAIAVLIYRYLIDSFKLQERFNIFVKKEISEHSIDFIELNKKDEIEEKLSRK